MFFGFLAVIISFYQSHKDHYTSKEIDKEIYSISKEEVKSFLKKNSKDIVTDNQVDSMMSSDRLPEKITDRIYQRISKELGCDLKRDHHLSGMGDILHISFNDSGKLKTISGQIDHAGFVKLPIDEANSIDLPLKYIYAKGLSLEEIKKKVNDKLKKQMNEEILKANLSNDDRLERENAILKNRELMGATDPAKAEEGTIRKKYGISIDKNSVHGSDSAENAKIEINFFFKEQEIVG